MAKYKKYELAVDHPTKFMRARVPDGWKWSRGIRGRIEGIHGKIVFDIESDPRYKHLTTTGKVKIANDTSKYNQAKYNLPQGELAEFTEELYDHYVFEFSRNRSIIAALNYTFMSLWADLKTADYLVMAEEKAMAHDDPGKLLNLINFVDKKLGTVEKHYKLKEFYEQKQRERLEKKKDEDNTYDPLELANAPQTN